MPFSEEGGGIGSKMLDIFNYRFHCMAINIYLLTRHLPDIGIYLWYYLSYHMQTGVLLLTRLISLFSFISDESAEEKVCD